MMPRTLLEEQLLFDLSQREGEITILRQRLATVEAERKHTVTICASLLATLRQMHVAIHDQLYAINSTNRYDQLVRERAASVPLSLPEDPTPLEAALVPLSLPEDPTPLEAALVPLVNDFLTGLRRLERTA